MLLVIFIVLLSVAYAFWLIYQAILQRNDPCYGCEGCALKGKIKKNVNCNAKKQQKNLVNQKK